MILLHPAALLGLLLLPLLVVFYIWRAQHRRQVVSSTWLWKEVQAGVSHRPSRRLPLHEPLLLLQLLAVLLVTLLLAGPTINHPLRVYRIVVLDHSLTMNAADVQPTRWLAARARAEELLRTRGADERITLVLAGSQARLLGEAPGNVDLVHLLTTLPPPGGTADLAGAAQLVRGLVNTARGVTTKVLFLASAQTAALPLPAVDTVRLGGVLDDQSISTLSARCLPSGACQGFARLRNSANSPRLDTLAVWADARLLGRQTVQIPAQGSLDLDFAIPADLHVLRASLLRRDALAGDNTAWTLSPLPEPRSVVLVSDAPGQLQIALQAIPGLTVQVVAQAAYDGTQAVGKDLVILDGILPDILPPNPVLIVNPPAGSALISTHAASTFLPITHVAQHDPLVAGLDLFHLAITGSAISTPSWAQVAAGGPNGPAILDGTLQGQRLAVLPWDTAQSPTTHDPVFPLLIERLVLWLAPSLPPSVPQETAVTLPGGVLSVRDPAGLVQTGPVIIAAQPGVYRVDATVGARAANSPLFVVPSSSDAPAAPPIVSPAWALPASGMALPQDLWPLVLSLALLALSGEWWFYTRKT